VRISVYMRVFLALLYFLLAVFFMYFCVVSEREYFDFLTIDLSSVYSDIILLLYIDILIQCYAHSTY
jgi:hypothetical protein